MMTVFTVWIFLHAPCGLVIARRINHLLRQIHHKVP